MDSVDLVDDVAQQVAADHAVLHALEHVGDDFALATFFAFSGQAAQVGKQAHADVAIDALGGFLAYEGQQFVTRDAVLPCCPVTPAVGRFDDGLVALAVELGFLLMNRFKVVEKLQEHHPGEQGQAIHIAVEPLVLAQNLARAADQGRQVLARGERRLGLACGTRLFAYGLGGGGFGHQVGFSLWVKRTLQPGDRILHAAHAAEMAGGDF